MTATLYESIQDPEPGRTHRLVLDAMRWHGWGKPEAIGSGTVEQCVGPIFPDASKAPACTQPAAATVVLSRPRFVGCSARDGRQYSHVLVVPTPTMIPEEQPYESDVDANGCAGVPSP